MKTYLTAAIIGLLALTGEQVVAQASQESVSLLWKGVGGKNRWDNTNYILFAASGNDSKHVQSGRKFLIDKRSGQVRFEGRLGDGDNIVAIFNCKTDKLLKLSSNGNEGKPNSTEADDVFAKINEQFKKDARFIFLPTLVDKAGKASLKIVNAEKLQHITFQLKDNSLGGELYFNPETGYIKQLVDKDGNEFYVNGYKDIGGGLFLPTTFKSIDNQDKSTSFTTVAAFTEMEDSKFSTL
ncbi:hypothetical protein [Sphingobacterium griseoflavum]|uniref:Uncharacterized protein n=1 Tax=Sphingobacterium griseoflavum TaxID=1474952 RepID=A0ABQ3HYX9_9SPHI|nr:hypothetical protein [Sphingobacterium griseoflavum]GHE37179.1 hypothetical protein GCM10017764_20500 [Sphingobacterium griseoflavum]